MCTKFVVLLLSIGIVSCRSNPEKTKPTVENITESVYASGIVKTENQYQAFPVVSGIIDKVYVSENDIVKEGTPLMTIFDETSRINRENASLTAAFADLRVNEEKLTDVLNNIALLQKKCSNDSLVFARQQSLWAQHIGSRLDLEQKELAYQSSKIALESARIKYNDLKKQLQFNARQSKNNLAISKYRERDYIIRSEIDGRVYSLPRERGEMVTPQTVIAVIGDATAFLLDLQIDEYDIAKVSIGQQVIITIDSYKGKAFEAKVTKIYPFMNERTKSFSIEAHFTSMPPVLYPNLTIEANIIIRAKQRALTIPRNYLIDDSLVLMAKGIKKAIVTGLKDYQRVEIISGITPNDVIYKPKE